MIKPNIKIEEQIADAYFCETEGEFHKLCIATCKVHTDTPEEAEMFLVGLRTILHEYLALVLSKKMTPYEMDEEWVKSEMDGFKGTIACVNEFFAEIGMPMYEGENGKMEIDYKKIREDLDEREKNDR